MNAIKAGILAAFVVCLISGAIALKNPAQVYCIGMGYEYYIAETPDSQTEICKLPDGSLVNAWWFLEGRIKQDYSYCAQEGYGMKNVSDSRCENIYSDNCLVCVLPNSSEAEVSGLMGLDFSELVCGDGICGMGPENYTSCPQDCMSNATDGVCNPSADGCDPDCENDPECENITEGGNIVTNLDKPADAMPILLIVLAVSAVGITASILKKRAI